MVTWIKDRILAVGPSVSHLSGTDELVKAGIRAIINLEESVKYSDLDLKGMELYHYPIRDFSVPDQDTIERFLVTVQHHFERGEPVYVHCTAGCGRTGTMVGIWLATLLEYHTFDDLVESLRSIRPCAIETEDQLAVVQQYFNRFSD